ncbi:MAG: DUF483 domain-containing protein [Bacillota bacterium]|nr:DUF483 domain-containing protein [Bacillota bacterium]
MTGPAIPEALVRDLLSDQAVLDRVKVEDLLPVAAGARPAALIVLPADLPDAYALGGAIDALVSQHRARWQVALRPQAKLRRQADLLREAYGRVVESAPTYRFLSEWIERLGLNAWQLEVRPTVRYLVVYRDPVAVPVLAELGEMLAERRKRMGGWAETEPRFAESLGKVLGYPACCLDNYVRHLADGTPYEDSLAAQLAAGVARGDEPDESVFFASGFLPCGPRCGAARAIGTGIVETLAAWLPEMASRYRQMCRENLTEAARPPAERRRYVEVLERTRRLLGGYDEA